jgi:polyisoprenyl-teichoic acid--peptidoglycan teichoic acid transferase
VKKKKSYIIWGIYTLLILFIINFGFYTARTLSKLTIIEAFLTLMPQKSIHGINILAFGIDETKNVKRADSIMVIHINEKNKRMGVLSIPRDTRISIPGYGKTKANHAFAHGGTKLLTQSISDFLGIPIDYFIKINLKGVEAIIDEIGGISININKDLYYVDQAGDLFIDLKKGNQSLTGKQAIEYLRFRQDKEGDIGRIQRQQKFINSFASRAISASKLLGTKRIIKQINKNIITNLSTGQMINLAVQSSQIFRQGSIEANTVPGVIILDNGISFWRPDLFSLDKILTKTLFGFEQQKNIATKIDTIDASSSQDNRRSVTPKEVSRISKQIKTVNSPISTAAKQLTVEVLNGCGVPGEAQITARILKQKGIKIARFGNAASFDYNETLIVDWKGNLPKTLQLAKFLQIDPSNIIVYDRLDKPLDATIVVGNNWEILKKKIAENE